MAKVGLIAAPMLKVSTWSGLTYKVNTVTQGTKMDLNTKSLPKQKTTKSVIYKTQGFQLTINENPPTREIFFDKFWFSRAGIEPGTFGIDV